MSDPFAPIPIFSTPFFTVRVQDYPLHQENLLNVIDGLRRTDPGVQLSNRGGWHSSGTFLDVDSPSVRWLQGVVLGFARRSVGRRYADPMELQLGKSWATVLEPGGWHVPHHHLPAEWSGVFYLRVDNEQDPEDSSGMLELIHPSPARSEGNFGLNPQDGMLVLFPSSLLHFVHPYTGSGNRVAMAFNLRGA